MRESVFPCAQVGTDSTKQESKSKEEPLERQGLRKALNTRIFHERDQGVQRFVWGAPCAQVGTGSQDFRCQSCC